MSRDVEVLGDLSTDLLAESSDGSVPEALRGRAARHRAALTAAIATLDALERQGVAGEHCTAPACAGQTRKRPTLAPSEDLAERCRALTAALEHMQWCRSCAESSWEQCDEGRKAYRLVNPHKSWCRDSEHEGACISDPSEVAP